MGGKAAHILNCPEAEYLTEEVFSREVKQACYLEQKLSRGQPRCDSKGSSRVQIMSQDSLNLREGSRLSCSYLAFSHWLDVLKGGQNPANTLVWG